MHGGRAVGRRGGASTGAASLVSLGSVDDRGGCGAREFGWTVGKRSEGSVTSTCAPTDRVCIHSASGSGF